SLGRSSWTSWPASAPTASARRSTGLGANGLSRREHVLERAQLRRGADRDQDVAGVEVDVRVGRRVEAAVALAERDDHRAGRAADAQLADRPTGLRAVRGHLDL